MKSLSYSLFLCLVLLAASCSEEEVINPNMSLTDFLAKSNLNTQVTSTGLNYIIVNEGQEAKPNLSADIIVDYEGSFLCGDAFDASTIDTFRLGNTILGWQEGLQLIGEGGSIRLFIPSDLAYGSRGLRDILPNTDLGFDIELISFENQYLDLEDFVEPDSINPQVTSSGLNFIINDEGTAPNPMPGSEVIVDFDGYFLGVRTFDSGEDVTLELDSLMVGWQEGLQLIGTGGSISLFIPSELAFGETGEGEVPPNIDVGYDIVLKSFE